MKKLGATGYRFSIAWSRIIPEADGKVNEKGIEHYRRLIGMLRDNGIKPMVTMFHWDLPQYLQDQGGWPNRDTAYRFADYAAVLAKEFGDEVDVWATLNEPACSAFNGYGDGSLAPGIRDYSQVLATAHHLNLAHGLGIQAIRAELGDSAKTSVALDIQVTRAVSQSEKDLLAKRRADLFHNEIWLGPMLEGDYDPELIEVGRQVTDWNFIHDGDNKIIHQPIQILGLNYYTTAYVRAATEAELKDGSIPRSGKPCQEAVYNVVPTKDVTEMGWRQEPEGFTDQLVTMSKRFPDLELVVTENGSAWKDDVSEDSEAPGQKIIHDPKRVQYLKNHLEALSNAIDDGAKVIGYYAWSLLDNFEWAQGYTKRFGLIGVDFDSQERIWKDSARFYQKVIKETLENSQRS
jgi:beta-glucosidase